MHSVPCTTDASKSSDKLLTPCAVRNEANIHLRNAADAVRVTVSESPTIHPAVNRMTPFFAVALGPTLALSHRGRHFGLYRHAPVAEKSTVCHSHLRSPLNHVRLGLRQILVSRNGDVQGEHNHVKIIAAQSNREIVHVVIVKETASPFSQALTDDCHCAEDSGTSHSKGWPNVMELPSMSTTRN